MAQDIFAHMKESNVKATESTYTALARVIIANGEPEKALALVPEMKAAGLAPKLRTIAPALEKFCELGRLEEASAVEE
eukprot:9237592-Pyramimonas_sp.AAC.1